MERSKNIMNCLNFNPRGEIGTGGRRGHNRTVAGLENCHIVGYTPADDVAAVSTGDSVIAADNFC